MDPVVLGVFVAVYLGMILGRLPGLRIDRTGIAVLGAVVLLITGRIDTATAWGAIDAPTLGLLVGLMVVSAQLGAGGFYAAVTRRIASADASPERLLGVLCVVAGGLSALVANDVVCLAMAPILIDGCARRRLDPVPFLLVLAAAANVGSAATIVGNPQNMLIGQRLDIDFVDYLVAAVPPAVCGLAVTWWIACRQWRGRFVRDVPFGAADPRAFDRWQSGKGVAVLGLLVVAFVLDPAPREVLALGAAGVLLVSRRTASRALFAAVDWQLCLLFIGLFVVHGALERSGAPHAALQVLADRGVDLTVPGTMFAATVVLSNLVSNVPAVMLLLPAATTPIAGPLLALSSTLAGNLLLVGSIANLIVVEQAERVGVVPTGRSWFVAHARFGIPVTIATLAIAALWLALRAAA